MAYTNFPTGFNITSDSPIESRIVLSKAEMKVKSDVNMPNKYLALCSDDNKFYVYDKTNTASVTTGKFKPAEEYFDAITYAEIVGAPTNVSSFTNDAGYITSSHHDTTKQDALTSANAGTNVTITTVDGVIKINAAGVEAVDNYNDLRNKPKINNVELSGNKTLAQIGAQAAINSSNKLSANVVNEETNKNFMTDAQKQYVNEQLAISKFTGTITPASSVESVLTATSPKTFTLTTKFDGTNVDLDSIPDGWTKTASTTGVYTKIVSFDPTGSTLPRASSGSVDCVYNGATKTVPANNATIIKPAYIATSSSQGVGPTDFDTLIAQENTQSFTDAMNIVGDRTVTGTTNKYVFILVPCYKTVSVKQMGLKIVGDPVTITGVTINSKNIGNYYYYRTELIGTSSIDITIS